jgi:hypothetical protein
MFALLRCGRRVREVEGDVGCGDFERSSSGCWDQTEERSWREVLLVPRNCQHGKSGKAESDERVS